MSHTANAARTDPIPAWVAYAGVIGVGGTALFVLAYYQHEFGVRFAQMPGPLAWTFSIGLDWGSAVAGIFWFLGTGKLSTWGRTFAVLLLVGSTALTCVSFGLIVGWQFAPLGAIHSIVAFAMAKLLTLWQADRQARRGNVDALDAYRAETEHERAAVIAELDQHRAEALADLEARHAAMGADLTRQQAALAQRQQLLMQATVAALTNVAAAKARPAPRVVPPAGRAVPPAGGDHHRRRVPADVELLDRVIDFVRKAQKDDEPYGQRPVAQAMGVSREKVRVPLEAARDVLGIEQATSDEARQLIEAAREVLAWDVLDDTTPTAELPHVNGTKVPIPYHQE